MEFTEDMLAVLVDHLKSVAAVSVHVPEAVGGTSVAKQEGDLVQCLGTQGDEVPECIWIL